MPFKFSNSATATLSSSITSTTTSVTVAAGLGSLFPSLSAGETFQAVLVDSSNNVEIVSVTARSADVMTVVRAQEGTSARAFSSGSRFEMRLTSAALTNFVQLDGAQTITGQKTFSQAIIGNLQGNVTGNLQGNVTGNLQGNVTGNVTGNITGNAATVTNGVYTVGDQTIGGSKTFSSVVTNSAGRYTTANTGLGMYEMHLPGIAARGWYLSGDGVTRLGVTNGAGVTSTVLLSVDGSGNTNITGDITANSDERLKTNWRDLDDLFLENLAGVQVGIYDRRDIGGTQVGVSAQSLWRVLPQAVRKGADGILSVAYGNAALAAAVKLAREVVSLRRELNEMKGA